MMILAQATEMTQAAADLVSARDVVPFMGAAIALLLGALVYLFRLREQERTAHFAQQAQIIEKLTTSKGD